MSFAKVPELAAMIMATADNGFARKPIRPLMYGHFILGRILAGRFHACASFQQLIEGLLIIGQQDSFA